MQKMVLKLKSALLKIPGNTVNASKILLKKKMIKSVKKLKTWSLVVE